MLLVYYGQEQHFDGAFNPVNREALWLTKYNTDAPLYKLTASLNAIRSHAFEKDDTYGNYVGFTIYHDEHTMAMRKGFDGNQVITVLTNEGEGAGSHTLNLKNTGFQAGEKIMEVLTCKEQTTQSDGSINVTMQNGSPRVFYPSSALTGSKVCQPGSSSTGSGSGPSASNKTNSAISARKVFGQSSTLASVGVLSLLIPILF
jgi:alpha-amylase